MQIKETALDHLKDIAKAAIFVISFFITICLALLALKIIDTLKDSLWPERVINTHTIPKTSK